MPAQDISQVYTLGPCDIKYKSTDLGHSIGEVKAAFKAKKGQAKVALYGDTPVAEWLNGQELDIEFVLVQTDMAILAVAFAGMTPVTDGSHTKLTLGQMAGTPIVPGTLTLAPQLTLGQNATLTCQANPSADFEPVYDGGKWVGYKCKFTGIINEAGGSEGAWLAIFGDPTITPAGSAPTVTAVVPASGATGVAATDPVIATLSAELLKGTVNEGSVWLVEDPLGTPKMIPGAVTLANNGALTTVTFKSTASLSAGKEYSFGMEGSITDSAGRGLVTGAVPGFNSYFTVAP